MEAVDRPNLAAVPVSRGGSILLLGLLLLGLAGCVHSPPIAAGKSGTGAGEGAYTGLWVAPENDKISFELDLTQRNLLLEGYHAALVGDSGAIEVALPSDREPPSVRGRIDAEGRAWVHFELRKSAGSGEAMLRVSGNKLTWKLLSVSGAEVLPKSCVLLKQAGPTH